ncbi:protein complexed with Cdc5 protein Cwf19 [Histoplasma capsulatum var. duboisii H88]|uniref:Complexed with Cdc5 protein Cwf19 n=1 Tax=Ajellomyces capsulatus (strain H88) TaxID=544711 RepID=F0UBX2_AJEC8|nr:protein complexed with Cdc5 protein Cwf19 [Histoplasma capsulatum var. duboisii H88]QSS49308.1 complexed with Cdc5 protein Cwf19 [Histoplasma capsulatum var. duboisii H88]
MTLDDFEKELAASQKKREREKSKETHQEKRKDQDRDRDRHRHRDKDRDRYRDREKNRDRGNDRDRERDKDRHSSHHHSRRHHSSRHSNYQDENENGHRHKRSRYSGSNGDGNSDRSQKRGSRHEESGKAGEPDLLTSHISPLPIREEEPTGLQRDSWMEAPSALDIDYVQRPKPKQSEPSTKRKLQVDYELKLHERELNRHLHDINEDEEPEPDGKDVGVPTKHDVDYTFGDAGSQWRMTKLKAVYRQAKETGARVEDVAIERFGDLRSFDDAREEEIELERRQTYGEDYVGKEKPSGELYRERKLDRGLKEKEERQTRKEDEDPSGFQLHSRQSVEFGPLITQQTKQLDSTDLNRLKAQVMKAKLRKTPNVAELEAEYNAAIASMANRKDPDLVVLGVMDNRLLAGGERREVKPVDTKRGNERGQVQENEDMTIEDMVREERRTRGQAGGEGQRFAERIAKDAKFDNDLEYMDENAAKLAKRVQKSDINIKNTAINEFQKMNRILDSCPLCYHEDTETPPLAPVVSLATRVYLTLPTEPELCEGSACIVPIQHRSNLLECDDDEWEEIRNFMKSLTRMYHDQGRDVIFYENAAQPQRHRHAAMEVVPLPYALGETSPAFFKEAILAADEEWTQHKKLIDTLAQARAGMGKLAFRRTIAKEMPYFHVWFELDGGLGHIVEDTNRWPRGDLFAREVIGGMLDLEPDIIKRQGRWRKGTDGRVDGFKKRWRKFDWTRVLTEG